MKDKPLSEKIEVVGFHTEVIFKDKDGNKKIVNATKGEEGLKVKDVKKAVDKLKEELKFDTYYQKVCFLIDKHFGNFE